MINISLPQSDISIVQKVAHVTKLPRRLLEAVMQAESAGKMRVISKAGAIGAMQVLPSTAIQWHLNPFDRYQNILAGALFLKEVLHLFDGSLKLALAAYNARPGAVQYYRDHVPPFPQTLAYVHEALRLYAPARY